MAGTDRLTVYRTMLDTGLVPLFYHEDVQVACAVADAVAAGGARVLEFTNRGPGALTVFTALAEHIRATQLPLVLGIGSIIDGATAALFIAHGAELVVSPILAEDVARLCNRRKIAYVPGCATATEISRAEELGAEIVKIFPGAAAGGPGFIQAVREPMPWSRLMPTGGVDITEDSIAAWLRAGAACLGMGSRLIRKEWIAAGDYGAMRDAVHAVLQMIARHRKH